jgi:GNAT superfamily N-acetyltransferase
MHARLAPARPADIDPIRRLDRQLFPDVRDEFDVDGFFQLPPDYLRLSYFPVLKAGDAVFAFALLAPSRVTVDGEPSIDTTTGELVRIGVRPEYQGHDVATTLVAAVHDAAADIGYRQLVAHTTTDGAGLLRSLGWVSPGADQPDEWVTPGKDLLPQLPAAAATVTFTADPDRSVARIAVVASEQPRVLR